MIYEAVLGNKYIIDDFIDDVELRLDHQQILPFNSITKIDRNTVQIDTPLSYEIGQGVSIGGFETGNKGFRMLELSITDFPVLQNSYITKIINKKYELMVI